MPAPKYMKKLPTASHHNVPASPTARPGAPRGLKHTPPPPKSTVCIAWSRYGQCQFGARCLHAHDELPAPAPAEALAPPTTSRAEVRGVLISLLHSARESSSLADYDAAYRVADSLLLTAQGRDAAAVARARRLARAVPRDAGGRAPERRAGGARADAAVCDVAICGRQGRRRRESLGRTNRQDRQCLCQRGVPVGRHRPVPRGANCNHFGSARDGTQVSVGR